MPSTSILEGRNKVLNGTMVEHIAPIGLGSLGSCTLNQADNSTFFFLPSSQEIQAEDTFPSISMMSSTLAIPPLCTEAQIRPASQIEKKKKMPFN